MVTLVFVRKLFKILLSFPDIGNYFSLTLAAGVVSKEATFFISQSEDQVTIDACPTSFVQFIPPKNESVPTVSLTETERIGWIWSIFFLS